ncbi:hypothetical protein [Campylobacter showae]|uniref:Uncharacterized protein n=1 Tax=Campylobacter showae CC57C TaxID=1073353 RepID=M3IK09_9BACT|nr:hypothetical protein [Campylobacter showae]EMG30411.1 hypothetical protein H740_06687 [Campylobacter showae CC57C]
MNLEEIKDKIKNSYLYTVFIERPMKGNGSYIRNITSIFSMFVIIPLCLLIIACIIIDTVFFSEVKPLNELTKNYGIVESANYKPRGGQGRLGLKLDDGSRMFFHIDNRDKNIYDSLMNKGAIIYSRKFLLGNQILQLEGENGEIYTIYNYEYELTKNFRAMNFIFDVFKIAVFFLIIVWILNNKDHRKLN